MTTSLGPSGVSFAVAHPAYRSLRALVLGVRSSTRFPRLAIGRSAAGVPRTYRTVRPRSWTRRLRNLLSRMKR